jgi:futalosine hydrolase
MRITIIAAMELELAPARKQLTAEHLTAKGVDLRYLYTGVGILESTYAIAREMDRHRPQLAIQAGIGGSFDRDRFGLASVMAVGEEVVGDIGVVEGHGFQNIFDMGFADPHGHPYRSGLLINPHHALLEATGLPVVRGLTVNEISTDPVKMQMMTAKYRPVIESMEGAPFHYVCLDQQVPFLQLRAVSNFIGERDRSNWDFKGSVKNLNETLIQLVHRFIDNPKTWN